MVIDNQRWKPTHIFSEYYHISDSGELYSVRANKVLKYNVDPDGYRYYVLCVSGERHTIKAHRLVALAFIPNPDNKPAIDHINGNKTDNRVCNLRWVTNKENSHNPITLKTLQENGKANISKLIKASKERGFGRKAVEVYKGKMLVGVFESQRLAAECIGVGEGHISSCLSGKRKQTHGYTFKRVDVKICP